MMEPAIILIVSVFLLPDAINRSVCADKEIALRHCDGCPGDIPHRITHFGFVEEFELISGFDYEDIPEVIHEVDFPIGTGW